MTHWRWCFMTTNRPIDVWQVAVSCAVTRGSGSMAYMLKSYQTVQGWHLQNLDGTSVKPNAIFEANGALCSLSWFEYRNKHVRNYIHLYSSWFILFQFYYICELIKRQSQSVYNVIRFGIVRRTPQNKRLERPSRRVMALTRVIAGRSLHIKGSAEALTRDVLWLY